MNEFLTVKGRGEQGGRKGVGQLLEGAYWSLRAQNVDIFSIKCLALVPWGQNVVSLACLLLFLVAFGWLQA